MKDLKLTVLRIGTGLFSLIAIITGTRLLLIGARGVLGDSAADLVALPTLMVWMPPQKGITMCRGDVAVTSQK